MSIERFDRKRDDLLKLLFEKYSKAYLEFESEPKENDIKSTLSELSSKLKISQKELRDICIIMVHNKEVSYTKCPDSNVEFMHICNPGLIAFSERKYYLSGRKLRLDVVYDIFKIISGFILLPITIVSFLLTTLDTCTKRKTEQSKLQRLQELEKEVNKIQILLPNIQNNLKRLDKVCKDSCDRK